MSKNKLDKQEIEYRPARLADAKLASRLIFDTFPKLATFIIGLGNEARAKKILARIFQMEGHRFSYCYTEMVLVHGKRVGLVIAYPGKKLGKLNWRTAKVLFQQYRFRGKLALITRTWPLVFIKEANRNEFLLSNLAVKKGYRGLGIGADLLSHVEKQASQLGYQKVALMVAIENKEARRFYQQHGYLVKALHLESNKRVRYLGPGYQRMVKNLD